MIKIAPFDWFFLGFYCFFFQVFWRFFKKYKGSLSNEQCVNSLKNYDGFLMIIVWSMCDYCVSVILDKGESCQSNFGHERQGHDFLVVLATEGSFEFDDCWIVAHWFKLFFCSSLKFVVGYVQDLIIGLTKLESFHGQLFWSIVDLRSTQSTTKSGCSEKSQCHDNSFDCHCLIWLFACCFDCW